MAKTNADSRYARKKGRAWVVTLPPELREHLGITHRIPLFWHYPRRGEAVLALDAERKAGAPLRSDLLRELAEARAQIEAIRRRDEARDRSMYAEGFAHGYMQSYERLVTPHGPSAERGHRRSMYRWAFPKAAQLAEPKQSAPRAAPSKPRPNARTRRAKRDTAPDARHVETVSAPVLDAPLLQETPA
jgi:hypothetical protein